MSWGTKGAAAMVSDGKLGSGIDERCEKGVSDLCVEERGDLS